MSLRVAGFALLFSLLAATGVAQHSVDPLARYYRVICLVHVTGTGKANDPIRPEHVPKGDAASRDGIIAWSLQMTDDKQMAIVHMVAVNRKAFQEVFEDSRSEIRVFEIGRHKKDEIELELRKYKKDFDLTKFEVPVR